MGQDRASPLAATGTGVGLDDVDDGTLGMVGGGQPGPDGRHQARATICGSSVKQIKKRGALEGMGELSAGVGGSATASDM